MELDLFEFIDILSFKTSWFEGHPLWVIISFFIYASLLGLFLNAIRMSIKHEKIHKQERTKTYGRFSKDILIIGLTIALIILSYVSYQKL